LGGLDKVREFVEHIWEIRRKITEENVLTTIVDNKIVVREGSRIYDAEEWKPFVECKKLLRELYDQLIKPIKDKLKEKIIIVPHGILYLIPFNALNDGESYLIEKHEMTLVPACSSIPVLKKRKTEIRRALLVGNPTEDLRFSEKEVEEIGKVLRGVEVEIFKGDEAKREKIMKILSECQLVHFACHGTFNPQIPGLSGLVMSDGTITAYDFLSLKLDAEVMVLSACESGVVRTTMGDEIEGLIRAIQISGVKYVIASLWLANDRITMEIFRDFYSLDGNVAERMREAMRKRLKKYPFYFWSPFQVYGC